MPAKALQRDAAALLGYVCVALAFAWPLPLRLADAMLGFPSGDAGVYVWNLWVFRHEIVEHHRLPFLTAEILALNPPVSLSLHNYTTFANLLAFPLIPYLGVLRTFNVLVIAAGVLSGYAMYWYARARTGDAVAAWVGGLLFGFSPFMSARAAEHFSLTLAAPLPVFGYLMFRLYNQPSLTIACAAGATVAWAFLCDAYFAVYCLLIASFTALYTMVTVERREPSVSRAWPRMLVNLAIVCVAGLIVGMILRGGGRMDVFGVRVSFTRLYTPMLILTTLVLLRTWLSIRARIEHVTPISRYVAAAAVAGLVCTALLTPVLSANGLPFSERNWISPPVLWRNSAPGIDLLAFVAPNPLHPLFGRWTFAWLSSMDAGFHENVASIPWVALLTIAGVAWWTRTRPDKSWLVFTGVFALLALGPFISVARHLTYVPTPWSVLRYLPIFGAARMPTRLTIVVMMGVSMLLAFAIRDLRARARRPWLVVGAIAALLVFELLPAPRTLNAAVVPMVYRLVADDPRPVRVLTLPFGLKDGLRSRGNYSASSQFYQTVHEKRLVGGYISRLPHDSIERYRGNSTLRVLMRMSEGTEVEPELHDRGLARAGRTMDRLQIGYVVIDLNRCSPELIAFAKKAFHLSPVAGAEGLELYRTPVAPAIQP
jgi:hypothetical protein